MTHFIGIASRAALHASRGEAIHCDSIAAISARVGERRAGCWILSAVSSASLMLPPSACFSAISAERLSKVISSARNETCRAASNRPDAISRRSPVTAGLQEILLLYPGHLLPVDSPDFTFEPLLQTGRTAGSSSFFDLVRTANKFPGDVRGRLDQIEALIRLALIDLGAADPAPQLVQQRTWELLSRLTVLMPRLETADEEDWAAVTNALIHVARGVDLYGA